MCYGHVAARGLLHEREVLLLAHVADGDGVGIGPFDNVISQLRGEDTQISELIILLFVGHEVRHAVATRELTVNGPIACMAFMGGGEGTALSMFAQISGSTTQALKIALSRGVDS